MSYNKKMDDQTICIFITLVLIAVYYNGDDSLYLKYDSLSFVGKQDSFTCRLLSLGIASFILAFLWNTYINNYV